MTTKYPWDSKEQYDAYIADMEQLAKAISAFPHREYKAAQLNEILTQYSDERFVAWCDPGFKWTIYRFDKFGNYTISVDGQLP